MKSFFASLLLILIQLVGSSQFTDNFSDGNFTSSPAWNGNTTDFQVSSGELQLNAPSISSNKYLSTNSQAINSAVWEFRVRLNFNPSSSNYTKIYLVSNTGNMTGSLNGYYLKIGGTDDEVSLYSQTGTSTNKIIDGRNGVVNSSVVDIKIRVTRSTTGNWQVFSDTTTGFTSFISEGTTLDNTHSQSLFFGVACHFTSTRSDKFYFDDFVVTGSPAIDNTKPTLDSVKVISNTQLELVYNEPVDATTSQNTSNYSVNNGIGTPFSAIQNTTDLSKITLTFSSPFTHGITNVLSVTNVTDIAGNNINPVTKNFIYFIPATPLYREVVINEIFADPSPVVGLPDAEYIEVYNATATKFFQLSGWEISDGSSTSTLPNFALAPNSYVILYSSSTTGDFSIYPNKIGLSSFPSLNNSGETITLKDNIGSTIDGVTYSLSTYQNTVKDDGGYALEQINPKANCFNSTNWIASSNRNGGTPGVINSVNDTTPDTSNPKILSAFALTNSTVEITFNKPIDTALFFRDMVLSDSRVVTSYSSLNYFGTQLLLTVSPALDTGKVYLLLLDSLTDCEGNIYKTNTEVILANRNKIGTVILNEVLFNPFSGEEDFVELYNNSNLYIDLKGWSLANDDNGTPDNLKGIPNHYVLKPSEYVVITKDYQVILNRYYTNSPTNFIELESLPTYSNDEGTVYLLTPTNGTSDKFSYMGAYHFSLLRDKEGVSLERLDFNRTTQDPSNWHSAAEEVGFATPGIKNSQFSPTTSTEETFSLSPEVFSPDNDGFEDVITFSYRMKESGFVGNVTIYDANGRPIKVLIKNQLLAQRGSFSWDGTTDNSTKARIGRYIILFEFFDLEGNVSTVKKTCVVAHKL